MEGGDESVLSSVPGRRSPCRGRLCTHSSICLNAHERGLGLSFVSHRLLSLTMEWRERFVLEDAVECLEVDRLQMRSQRVQLSGVLLGKHLP